MSTMVEGHWLPIRDGDPRATYLHRRHYSRHRYRDNRRTWKIIGPGEYLLFLTLDCKAVLAWRKFTSDDDQEGVNCAVFRNEGPHLSSDLIREACDLAWRKWPGERLYTYVNARAVRSTNPGYCFLKAGFRKCGVTKVNKHLILERKPGMGGA